MTEGTGRKRLCRLFSVKRAAAAVTAALCIVAAPSCSTIDMSTEALMSPPRPTKQQEEIRLALTEALGTEEFDLRTPRTGGSAVAYNDLYGSPVFEATVLYSLKSSPDETRVHVLSRNADEEWATVCDFAPPEGGTVERLEFAYIEPTGYAQIVLGTSLYSGRGSALSVWSLDTGKPESVWSSSYRQIVCEDMDGDDMDEIITFNSISDGTGAAVTGTAVDMIGYSTADSCVKIKSSVLLDVYFTAWLQVMTGKLDTGSMAVFLDGMTGTDTYATEVVAVISGTLVKIFGTGCPTRNIAVTCRDINGDGSPEVPVQEIMTGYADAAASDRLPRIDWSSCGIAGLTARSVSAVNMKWGYILEIPERLVGEVTVLSEEEDDAWTICMWDSDRQSTSRKVLAVRSFISREWEEERELYPEQTVFARQGNVCYTVEFYRKDMISEEELKKLFTAI